MRPGRAGTSSTEDSTHAATRMASGMRSRGSGSSAGLGGEGRVRGGLPRSASIAARLGSAGVRRTRISTSRCRHSPHPKQCLPNQRKHGFFLFFFM